MLTAEVIIKGSFLFLTILYGLVTYRDTKERSPSNPSLSEWDVCWPIATWYISWHTAICLSVLSLPSRLFRLDQDLAGQNIPQGPDWRRLTILFSWYLVGIPTAYIMQDSCIVGAPGTWARGIRVFIEGVVAFGLGGSLYGLGRCLFPVHHSRPVLLPFLPEKSSSDSLFSVHHSRPVVLPFIPKSSSSDCLFPVHHSRPVLLPFIPKKSSSGQGVPKSNHAAETV